MNAKIALLCLPCLLLACTARAQDAKPAPKPDDAGKPHNYIAEHDAWVRSFPVDERAWPLYLDAIRSCPELLETEQSALQPLVALKPTDADWTEAVEFISDHEHTLRLLRQAASRAIVGRMWSDEPDPALLKLLGEPARPGHEEFSLLYFNLSDFGHFHETCRLLMLAAHVHAQAGDAEHTVEDILALQGIANQMQRDPDRELIQQMVAHAIMRRAVRVMLEVLATHPDLLDDASLRKLTPGLKKFPVSMSLHFLHIFVDDMLRRAFADNGEGRLTKHGWRIICAMTDSHEDSPVLEPGPQTDCRELAATSSWFATGREMRDVSDELLRLFESDLQTPLWEWKWKGKGSRYAVRNNDELGEGKGYYYAPVTLMLPASGKVYQIQEGTHLRLDAALVVIALHRYRLSHGRWPTGLADLVPEYLPEVPIDRYDGKPLRYRLSDAGPVVYSVGVDRDDDGGVGPPPGADPRSVWVFKSADSPDLPDGDWIFFPPSDDWSRTDAGAEFEAPSHARVFAMSSDTLRGH